MRQRRALSQLENVSDLSNPSTPEKRVDTANSIKEQKTIRKARHAEIFDEVRSTMKPFLIQKGLARKYVKKN